MKKIVKSIEITFNNIDYVVIPNHHFVSFSLENIRTDVCRIAANAIARYQTVSYASFVLKKEVNEDFDEFETDIDMICYGGGKFFERILKYKDIYHIKLIYDDEYSEEFSVKWEEEDEYGFKNSLQRSWLNDDGDLCVEIGEAYDKE